MQRMDRSTPASTLAADLNLPYDRRIAVQTANLSCNSFHDADPFIL